MSSFIEFKEKYGVEVPRLQDKRFYIHGKQNTPPTEEELEVISSALDIIPAPGFLCPLIITDRKFLDGPTTGVYLGYDWQNRLRVSSSDRYPLGTHNALMVELTPLSMDKPFKSSSDFSEVEQSIPIRSQADLLRVVVIHEEGHAFDDQIRRARATTDVEYQQYFYDHAIFTSNTFESENPLHQSFAHLKLEISNISNISRGIW